MGTITFYSGHSFPRRDISIKNLIYVRRDEFKENFDIPSDFAVKIVDMENKGTDCNYLCGDTVLDIKNAIGEWLFSRYDRLVKRKGFTDQAAREAIENKYAFVYYELKAGNYSVVDFVEYPKYWWYDKAYGLKLGYTNEHLLK